MIYKKRKNSISRKDRNILDSFKEEMKKAKNCADQMNIKKAIEHLSNATFLAKKLERSEVYEDLYS